VLVESLRLLSIKLPFPSHPHECPESDALFPAYRSSLRLYRSCESNRQMKFFPVDFAGQTDIELTEKSGVFYSEKTLGTDRISLRDIAMYYEIRPECHR